MGLSTILDRKASVVPTEQITLRLDVDLVAQAGEIADELEVPRAEVLREAFREGMRKVFGEWQAALAAGSKGQKKGGSK